MNIHSSSDTSTRLLPVKRETSHVRFTRENYSLTSCSHLEQKKIYTIKGRIVFVSKALNNSKTALLNNVLKNKFINRSFFQCRHGCNTKQKGVNKVSKVFLIIIFKFGLKRSPLCSVVATFWSSGKYSFEIFRLETKLTFSKPECLLFRCENRICQMKYDSQCSRIFRGRKNSHP